MANPWLERRVLNWAHQGGAKEGPSSTLHAMRKAVAAGADAIELDVHATSDGEIVVCHDPTVDRTCNAAGRIADLTLAEVRVLDNAYWWVPGEVVAHDRSDDAYVFRGEAPDDDAFTIPTLRQVLEEFPDIFLNFDIKQTAPEVKPYEQQVADLLREFGRADSVIVASFNDHATEAFSAIAPEVTTSLGLQGTAEFYFAVRDGKPPPATRHVALQVPPMSGDTEVVTSAFVDAAHEHGLVVHCWTIDDAAEMERLLDLNVDGVMTDCPTVLEEVLQRRGVAYA